MSLLRSTLVEFLDQTLLSDFELKDATFNGLQIEGKETIKTVGFAVDASLETFEEAREANVDFLITHHGLIWGALNRITGQNKDRLSVLLQNDINLYVSHLPLDKHEELGNNISIVRALNASPKDRFVDIGYVALLEKEIPYSEFLLQIKQNIGEIIAEMPFGPKLIRKVGISSGSFSLELLEEAIGSGISTILTGEGSSLLYHTALEAGINLIFAGHYATETFGVKALQKRIAQNFEVQTVFLDLPTGW